MTHASLFSGIGGFDLAAEWMGWQNVFHCEWNDFGKKVLKYYWPNSISYDDITKTDFTIHRESIDILSGGFPCQPYSSAGKRLGKEDERHLWPEMLRAIREIQPSWVVGENVRGLTNWNGGMVFNEVQFDLEAEGYEVLPFLLPACAVNAPHRRDRIWFVAFNTKSKRDTKVRGICKREDNESIGVCEINEYATDTLQVRLQQCEDGGEMGGGQSEVCGTGSEFANGTEANGEVRDAADTTQIVTNTKCIGRVEEWNDDGFIETPQQTECREQQFSGADSTQGWWRDFPSVSPICIGNDGFPNKLDGITFPKWRTESIKAGGNAVVPQVVYQIFKAIEQYNNQNEKS